MLHPKLSPNNLEAPGEGSRIFVFNDLPGYYFDVVSLAPILVPLSSLLLTAQFAYAQSKVWWGKLTSTSCRVQ